MLHAIELAKKGLGWTNPNPMVGAVIVKNGHIIGEGYHHIYGDLHAERDALKNLCEDPAGATIYVTLEPCCHHGKQPPCTEAIVNSGIKRVIVGSLDPNPLVSGKGFKYLEDNGVTVEGLLCNNECLELNYVFFNYIKEKKPYVILKYAETLDGKIATSAGLSRWITGEEARNLVHMDRHRYSAIMVGLGTVLSDDPMLNCRCNEIVNPHHPARIICDTGLNTPLNCKLVETANEIPTIIGTSCNDIDRIKLYTDKGCEVISVKEKNGHVDIKELVMQLGQKGIDSIIIEGGGNLNWSALDSGIVNHVQAYIAPKIFGGKDAKAPVSGAGVTEPSNAFVLRNTKITTHGEDILLEGDI